METEQGSYFLSDIIKTLVNLNCETTIIIHTNISRMSMMKRNAISSITSEHYWSWD